MNALLSTAAASMHGSLHGADRMFDGVSTDTRTLRSGELFFALTGPNFDGGAFVDQARDKGAAGAVVAAAVDAEIAQISVSDTRVALGELGAAWRSEQAATVVGVTGSNGKTTLKEMIAACLTQVARTLATSGNLNNEIGMPLMLLRIEPAHRYAVIEMGANHAGEIAYLASLAQPDVVVITNAAEAHLEGFGSIEGVARAKGEILQSVPRPTTAILNADDAYFDYWRSLVADIDLLSFGFDDSADVRGDEIALDTGRTRFRLHLAGGSYPVTLALAGIHNVRNACAAAAVATALGVAPDHVVAGLQSVSPVAGRLRPLEGLNGATLFDDSYNANPVSVVSAAEFLVSLAGRKWFVLGDMFELGDDARRLHHDVGRALREAGVDRLFAIGELSRSAVDAFGGAASWFDSVDDLLACLTAKLDHDVNLLVKGSRGMRMERVVDALRTPSVERREG